MRLLLIAAVAALPGATLAAPAVLQNDGQPSTDAKRCPQTTNHYAWKRGDPMVPRKLNELPDANAYAAVLRKVNGCEMPVVVRYGVSGRR